MVVRSLTTDPRRLGNSRHAHCVCCFDSVRPDRLCLRRGAAAWLLDSPGRPGPRYRAAGRRRSRAGTVPGASHHVPAGRRPDDALRLSQGARPRRDRLQAQHDGGLTWSDRLPTPASWATSKEVPTIHRVVDAAGRKRIIMWSGLYPARLAVSEDDGETWSELRAGRRLGRHRRDGLRRAAQRRRATTWRMFHDDGRFFTATSRKQDPPVMTLYKTLFQPTADSHGQSPKRSSPAATCTCASRARSVRPTASNWRSCCGRIAA